MRLDFLESPEYFLARLRIHTQVSARSLARTRARDGIADRTRRRRRLARRQFRRRFLRIAQQTRVAREETFAIMRRAFEHAAAVIDRARTIAMQSTGQGAMHNSQPEHSSARIVCITFDAPTIASTGHA